MSARSAISAGPTSTRSAASRSRKQFGDKIETTYLENVSEGPDSERSIEQLARAGHKLIFTTSFGYMDPTLKVAKKYPNIYFEHATGYKRDKNLATYSAPLLRRPLHPGPDRRQDVEDRRARLHRLVPDPGSDLRHQRHDARRADRSIPNIKVKIIWVNTWFDPGKEADAAKALLDQGADIMMQHTDSPAAMQVAAQRGALAFGQDSDMIKFGPKTQLTAHHQQLGAVLRRARASRARRQVEVRRHLGRARRPRW